MKLGVILVLMLTVIAVAGAVSSAHADSPFQAYNPGVMQGATNIYDCYGCYGISYSQVTISVNWIAGTIINYTETIQNDLYTQVRSGIIDVNTQIQSAPYPWFMAGGIHGGPMYPGSYMVTQSSLFGHIIFGNWRPTNYWDLKMDKYAVPFPGEIQHIEFDQITGSLTLYENIYNGAGTYIALRHTNLWDASPFWSLVGSGIHFLNTTWFFIFTGVEIYLTFFLVIGVYDWYHVRQLRGIHGRKSGGGGFPWKYMIMFAIIMTLVMISIILIIQFALQAAAGG